MARQRFEGTPKALRSKGWVFPDRSRATLWLSLGLAASVAVVMVGGYFAGVRRTLSPGTVVSQHASFDLKCAQCHEAGTAVTAVRCERCHDPSNSERLTHAAHILLGTGDPLAMARAEERPCQSCHIEHRGLAASLRAVDDRECGSCHVSDSGSALRSFDRHPEFAIIRARVTAGVGIKFDHARHLVEAQARRGTTCVVCHEQTPDRRVFLPMTFDRHCSGCHTMDGFLTGETEPIDATLVVLPTAIAARLLGDSSPRIETYPDDTVQGFGLRHRDGWVIFNALRLRSGIDPEGEEAERLTLRGQIGYLDALLRARSLPQVPAADLTRAIAELDREIAQIAARLARQASPEQDTAALAELAGTTRALARQLQGIDPAADEELRALANAPTPPASPRTTSPPTDGTDVLDRRKQELMRLLDAVTARTTDPGIQRRAAALRLQVERLLESDGAADTAPLLTRLDALESLIRALRSVPDAGLQAELARIDLERRYVQQQISAGLRPDDFEGHRRELLALLDAIDARGDEIRRLRSGALRQRLLAVRPGSAGDAELRRVRRQRQRQLERLRLELELRGSPRDQEPTPAQDAALDRPAIDATLQRLRAALTDLESAPAMEEADDEIALSDRLDAFRSLLGTACQKCHDLDPSGARLAPVRIAEPVMPRSVFNHAPHVTRASCETCHGSIKTSQYATDVNVPGKALCATCHAPSRTSADCETCHVYHPSSPAKLVSLTP